MKQIIQSIQQFAKTQPHAIAIQSASHTLSYAQLWTDIQHVEQLLKKQQVQSLAIYLDNGIEWIVTDLACQLAEVTTVALPWFFSRAQRQHACRDAAVDWVVASETLPPDVEGCSGGRLFYGNSMVYPIKRSAIARSHSVKGTRISYTSGTTGQPRGISLSPQMVEQTALSICALIQPMDIDSHLSVLPYATLLENIAGLYVPLLLGKKIYAEPAARIGLMPDLKLYAPQFARIIHETRAGSMIITPQLLEVLCILVEMNQVDPAQLQYVAVGGARVATELLNRAHGVGIPAYEGYGLTEFASVALLNTPQRHRPGSAGKPLPGVKLHISDDSEIILRRSLPDGEGSTFEVSVSTGDIGHIDDEGFVYVAGRKSNLIVLATGRNVSPEWIEAELNHSPMIRQSYVYGEAQPQLSALIYAESSIQNDQIQLEIERINRQLPAYALIINWQRLQQPFSTDDSTLTPNGRLRRKVIESKMSVLTGQNPYSPFASMTLQETTLC